MGEIVVLRLNYFFYFGCKISTVLQGCVIGSSYSLTIHKLSRFASIETKKVRGWYCDVEGKPLPVTLASLILSS